VISADENRTGHLLRGLKMDNDEKIKAELNDMELKVYNELISYIASDTKSFISFEKSDIKKIIQDIIHVILPVA
jgi:hypothetical protein